MLARMSWAGWAGQVRLACLSFILSPVFLLLFLWLVLWNKNMLFLILCSSFGSLWGSIFASFWHLWGTTWSTRGFPGQLCAHLSGCSEPHIQNVCKRWFPNPKGVIFGDHFCTFVVIFLTKNECVESVGSQVVFSALFRGSRDRLTLHPLQPAQSKHSFPCSVSP